MIGESYESAVQVDTLSDTEIEFTGSAYSLTLLYDKIMNCPTIKVQSSLSRDELIPNYVTSCIARLIDEKGTSMVKDKSKYTIKFTKL